MRAAWKSCEISRHNADYSESSFLAENLKPKQMWGIARRLPKQTVCCWRRTKPAVNDWNLGLVNFLIIFDLFGSLESNSELKNKVNLHRTAGVTSPQTTCDQTAMPLGFSGAGSVLSIECISKSCYTAFKLFEFQMRARWTQTLVGSRYLHKKRTATKRRYFSRSEEANCRATWSKFAARLLFLFEEALSGSLQRFESVRSSSATGETRK